MENNGDFVKIEKLQNPEDWATWKFEIRVILRDADLFDIVTGAIRAPIQGENQSDYAATLTAFNKNDFKAQKVIVTALGKQPKKHLMNCNTSKEMWEKLLSVYEQSSKTSIHLTQKKYYDYTKEEGDDVAMFVSKLLSIVEEMKDLGTVISDDMIFTKVLIGLPPEFNHFHSAWESTVETDRTITNLTSRLVLEELRINSQQESKLGEAFVAKGHSGYQKRSFDKLRSIKCFNCGEFGHYQRNCQLNRVQGQGSSRDTIAVRIGDGSLIDAVGIGKINILAFDGKDWHEKHLSDVLYVPQIHLNLFSQLRALDKNLTMVSSKMKCEFLDIDGRPIAICVRSSNLFRMEFKVMECEAMSLSASKETELHQSSRRCGTKATIWTRGNASLSSVSLSVWQGS